ncbi:VOC family protein [Chloroflexota bacterium]
MSKNSPAKVKAKSITQIGLVVKDLQKAVENYWNILGIGPWNVYAWEAPSVYDRKYHGKPSQAREKIATAKVGAIQLKLCQPIEGDSIYQDFLTEHGEGLHHLSFPVDNVDKTTDILAREGFPCLQSGHYGDNGAFSYIDIKPLHAIWEVVHEADTNVKSVRYPDKIQESSAKVKVKSIDQVALVVKDIHKVVENYWNILGIGQWSITPWETPLVYDRKYHGKPVGAIEKIAEVMVGQEQLELCQPIEGDSIFRDFLTEYGEGLHHMNFLVDNADETTEMLAKEGFPCLQIGHYGDNGAFSYIDIKPLHAVWEPVSEADSDIGPVRYP